MMNEQLVSAVTGSAVDASAFMQKLDRVSEHLEFCSLLLVILVVLGLHGLILRILKKGGVR